MQFGPVAVFEPMDEILYQNPDGSGIGFKG